MDELHLRRKEALLSVGEVNDEKVVVRRIRRLEYLAQKAKGLVTFKR
jgi:hypothetical protein